MVGGELTNCSIRDDRNCHGNLNFKRCETKYFSQVKLSYSSREVQDTSISDVNRNPF